MGGGRLDNLNAELRRLRDNNQDVATMLDAYKEAERVYREALEAMGLSTRHMPTVRNVAEVTVSFRDSASSDRRG